MKRLTLPGLLLFIFALALVAGCSEDAIQAPEENQVQTSIDHEAIALVLAAEFGWALDPEEAANPPQSGDRGCIPISHINRELVTDGIAHYSFQLQVGPGEFDKIGIHRVVRERRPYRPIRTRKAAFLQHGDIKDFVGMFLPGVSSPTMPDEFGLAVTLAQADIDVWGIDQAWALVPAGVTDFTFMADWGLDRAIDDLGTAMFVSRILRRITGGGFSAMPLLGYSSGSVTALALVNAETQLAPWRRSVSGYIGADYGMLTDDPVFYDIVVPEYEAYLEMLDNGIYASESFFQLFGPPAANDPDGPSELIPGFTNLQAAIGANSWPMYPEIPLHFTAGVFDDDGIPVGLQYTEVEMMVDFMVTGPPFEALRFMADYDACIVEPEAVPWDDHLAQVTVPVLYFAAVGGIGLHCYYTLEQLGSSDITTFDVSLHPPEEILLDYGHIDLFIANNAPELVYEPVKEWILDHTP